MDERKKRQLTSTRTAGSSSSALSSSSLKKQTNSPHKKNDHLQKSSHYKITNKKNEYSCMHAKSIALTETDELTKKNEKRQRKPSAKSNKAKR